MDFEEYRRYQINKRNRRSEAEKQAEDMRERMLFIETQHASAARLEREERRLAGIKAMNEKRRKTNGQET